MIELTIDVSSGQSDGFNPVFRSKTSVSRCDTTGQQRTVVSPIDVTTSIVTDRRLAQSSSVHASAHEQRDFIRLNLDNKLVTSIAT